MVANPGKITQWAIRVRGKSSGAFLLLHPPDEQGIRGTANRNQLTIAGPTYSADYRRRHPLGLPLPGSHAPHFDGTRLIKIFRGHADRREVGAVWRNFQAGPGNGLVHFCEFANDLAGGCVDESDYLVGARSDHLLAVGGEVNRQRLQQEIAIFRNKLPGVRVTNANDRGSLAGAMARMLPSAENAAALGACGKRN